MVKEYKATSSSVRVSQTLIYTLVLWTVTLARRCHSPHFAYII